MSGKPYQPCCADTLGNPVPCQHGRKRIVIFCSSPSGRHWWKKVNGIHSTPEHPYWERRCRRCRQYESEVR